MRPSKPSHPSSGEVAAACGGGEAPTTGRHWKDEVEVRPLARYRVWLRYQDGTEGEVDLSHLAGKGVFSVWEQEGVFARVKLGPHGQIEWPGEVDLCPDALYLTLTGKRPEDGTPVGHGRETM